MKRRKFIKTAGAAAAGAFAAPYILPSGRLFAQSGSQYAEHVVYVLFAGGVRHQESIGQAYLDDSQGLGSSYGGNIMTNMLTGAAPTKKIAYGKGTTGQTPLPNFYGPGGSESTQTLADQGVTFQEVQAASRGHYGGLNSLLQGNPAKAQGLQNKPINPTIYEYLRRHAGFAATDVWMIGNSIGSGIPLLNSSDVEGYGPQYGANFFAPTTTFGDPGQEWLMNAKNHPDEQLEHMRYMKYFLDNQFENYGKNLKTLGNTDAEIKHIKAFMQTMFQKTIAGSIDHAPEVASGAAVNGDLLTVGYTCEILKEFNPKFTVVNLTAVDTCHSNFTTYLQNLHRADYAVGYLWKYIQSLPGMKDNTILIATPECGRNDNPNPILDENNWLAYDHSDNNSLRVFTQMLGGSNTQNVPTNERIGGTNATKYNNQQIGKAVDNVVTIGEIFGIKSDIVGAGRISPDAVSLFDQM